MRQQRLDSRTITLHDAEDPVGEAGPLHDVGQYQRSGWILLGRLQHEAVSAGDGIGHHPQRHHDREVEGCDAGDHPHGLEHRTDVDPRRDLRVGRPLQEVRDAAGELDVLDAARHLSPRVFEDLAVLGRDGGGELVTTGIEQLTQAEQQAGPPGQRGEAPLVGRLEGRCHHRVDLGRRGESDLCGLDSPGRVVHRRRPPGGAGHGTPAIQCPMCRTSAEAGAIRPDLTASLGRRRSRPSGSG